MTECDLEYKLAPSISQATHCRKCLGIASEQRATGAACGLSASNANDFANGRSYCYEPCLVIIGRAEIMDHCTYWMYIEFRYEIYFVLHITSDYSGTSRGNPRLRI
jgi:hypothetical protein